MKFQQGDRVRFQDYVGVVILVNPNMPERVGIYKVLFDDSDGPDYNYYPEEELEKIDELPQRCGD